MITYGFYALLLACCAISLSHWRLGPFCVIAVALVQDPVRKMMPGAPVILVLSNALVWLCTLAGAMHADELRWNEFRTRFSRLAYWIGVLCIVLIPQALRSAAYGRGSWMVALLGLFAYGSLLAALLMGMRYPRRSGDLYRLLGFYCVLCAVLMTGVWLERAGFRHPAIGDSAMGHLWVTHRMGGTLRMRSGFFRSPDVMGWHAATLVMLSCILVLASQRRLVLAGFWAGLAMWGGMGAMVCGRRKMIAMLPVFAVCLGLLSFRERRFRGMPAFMAALGLILLGAGQIYTRGGRDAQLEAYYGTTLSDAGDRIYKHSVGAALSTVRQIGFWGHGVGTAHQGVHNLPVERPRTWQEGGTGKIVAELGVPGALVFAVVLWRLLTTGVQAIERTKGSAAHVLHAGLLSVVIANGAAGLVSAQIFGDPFVGTFLPLCLGLVLASARVRPLLGRRPVPVESTPDEAVAAEADESERSLDQ